MPRVTGISPLARLELLVVQVLDRLDPRDTSNNLDIRPLTGKAP